MNNRGVTTTVLRAALAASATLLLACGPVQGQDQTAEQRLDELDSRISRLEAMNQVERLQRSYGYFVDKRQWTQLADLFTDDATLEIGGKGIFIGKDRVLEYMQVAFGAEELATGFMGNHMQFQPVVNVSPDGQTAWMRSRAYVFGWGLPLYENEFRQEDGVWKISRLSGPFTMYSSWEGWAEYGMNNTWPDKFDPPPDLPPSTVYLTYPAYYIIPFHYPNPVTGKPFTPDVGQVGAYAAPPGTSAQIESLRVGRLADGTQPIALPPRE